MFCFIRSPANILLDASFTMARAGASKQGTCCCPARNGVSPSVSARTWLHSKGSGCVLQKKARKDKKKLVKW